MSGMKRRNDYSKKNMFICSYRDLTIVLRLTLKITIIFQTLLALRVECHFKYGSIFPSVRIIFVQGRYL